MDSLDKVLDFYNSSSGDDVFHHMAGVILHNLDKVNCYTIYDMAEICNTSVSSMSRLMKKMGFGSYPEFKKEIIYALQNFKYLNRNAKDLEVINQEDVIPLYFNFLQNNISNLRESIKYKDIKEASDLLCNASSIMMVANREFNLEWLQKPLAILGIKTIVSYDAFNICEVDNSMKENDVVLTFIPDFVELSNVRRLYRSAREKGIYIISVCSGKSNDYHEASDISINFQGTKTSMDIYLFHIILNLLKSDISNRYINPYVEDNYTF